MSYHCGVITVFTFVNAMKAEFNVWSLCRWQLTPQTRKMQTLRGPKTERGNAAVRETEIVKSHLPASAIVPVNETALNLPKGNRCTKRTHQEHQTDF